MTTASWPLYRGTKELKAKPMTKAEYCGLRGWRVPEDEDPNERGYVVEYQDGGKANVEGFEGYVSWSPADVFERTYKRSETYIDRLEIEQDELEERIEKLERFINNAGTPFAELNAMQQNLLTAQLHAMEAYITIISVRLSFAREG